eukprot:4658731-Pleurochrysis_carterae.AAC.1
MKRGIRHGTNLRLLPVLRLASKNLSLSARSNDKLRNQIIAIYFENYRLASFAREGDLAEEPRR